MRSSLGLFLKPQPWKTGCFSYELEEDWTAVLFSSQLSLEASVFTVISFEKVLFFPFAGFLHGFFSPFSILLLLRIWSQLVSLLSLRNHFLGPPSLAYPAI